MTDVKHSETHRSPTQGFLKCPCISQDALKEQARWSCGLEWGQAGHKAKASFFLMLLCELLPEGRHGPEFEGVLWPQMIQPRNPPYRCAQLLGFLLVLDEVKLINAMSHYNPLIAAFEMQEAPMIIFLKGHGGLIPLHRTLASDYWAEWMQSDLPFPFV